MAKDYVRAENAFAHAKSDVVLASINCDKYPKLGDRFKVGGYPTLLWFPKGSKEPQPYQAGRDFDSILAFVESKSGVRGAYKSLPTGKDMTAPDFEAFLQDRNSHGLVMFYAPCMSMFSSHMYRVWTLQEAQAGLRSSAGNF